MPYWQRQEALDRSFEAYRELYRDEDIEIIVADDGSPTPLSVSGDSPWHVRVVRLPKKTRALNPCVPINEAAAVSVGEILLITNPEIIHTVPIIGELRTRLESLGPQGHVSAACWGVNKSKWYCHSSIPSAGTLGRERTPPGSGFHFCSILYREFFYKVAGFSEEYRKGQAYEDNDFLWKLHFAGAKFEIADDLVVKHYSVPVSWPKGGHERNRQIFLNKWGGKIG